MIDLYKRDKNDPGKYIHTMTGLEYVNERLDAIGSSSKDPSVRREFPDYPSLDVVRRARSFANFWFQESWMRTPSVVPGFRGVEFIWFVNTFDIVVTVVTDGIRFYVKVKDSSDSYISAGLPMVMGLKELIQKEEEVPYDG